MPVPVLSALRLVSSAPQVQPPAKAALSDTIGLEPHAFHVSESLRGVFPAKGQQLLIARHVPQAST